MKIFFIFYRLIFSFIKKLVKYYIDKLINWMRMQKFNLELDNEIKEFHKNWLKENNLDEDAVIYLTKENTAKTIEGKILDNLRLNRMCCRRHMLTHVDIE